MNPVASNSTLSRIPRSSPPAEPQPEVQNSSDSQASTGTHDLAQGLDPAILHAADERRLELEATLSQFSQDASDSASKRSPRALLDAFFARPGSKQEHEFVLGKLRHECEVRAGQGSSITVSTTNPAKSHCRAPIVPSAYFAELKIDDKLKTDKNLTRPESREPSAPSSRFADPKTDKYLTRSEELVRTRAVNTFTPEQWILHENPDDPQQNSYSPEDVVLAQYQMAVEHHGDSAALPRKIVARGCDTETVLFMRKAQGKPDLERFLCMTPMGMLVRDCLRPLDMELVGLDWNPTLLEMRMTVQPRD